MRPSGAARPSTGPRPPLPLLVLLAAALALSACLFDSTPPVPPTPTPTPTPTPSPTPTAQQRVALPTPPPSPTVAPTPVSELRDAGQLLLIDSVDSGGERRRGLILANADGSDRRLVATGNYLAVEWSPDGERFAAVSAPGGPPDTVELFAADGRLLQRFAFAVITPFLHWSPDSRRVAAYGGAEGPRRGNATWLLGEEGAVEVRLGLDTAPSAWSPAGRLPVNVSRDADGDGRGDGRSWWTVDRTGGDARPLTDENLEWVGWSADGGALYALGDFQPFDASDPIYAEPTALLRLDARDGAPRTLATAADLAARFAPPDAGDTHVLGDAAVEPGSGRVAVALLTAKAQAGSPQASRQWTITLLALDPGPRLIRRERLEPGAAPRVGLAWAPGGARLACLLWSAMRLYALPSGDGATEIAPFPALVATTHFGSWFAPRWSSDSRWVAFPGRDGVAIAAAEAPARFWPLTSSHVTPAWRPRR